MSGVWIRCECNPFGALIRTTEPKPDYRTPCDKCNGRGAVPAVNDPAGMLPCWNCSGDGRVGRSRMKCPECAGTGVVKEKENQR